MLTTITAKARFFEKTDDIQKQNRNKNVDVVMKDVTEALKKVRKEKLKDLQGSLSITPVGKKFSLEEVIRKAEKKEAEMLANEI